MGSPYGITIELGGRTRTFRYDMNALSDLEKAHGRSLIETLGTPDRPMGFADIRALVWAGLRHENRTMTLEMAGSLIQAGIDAGISLAEILMKVNEAVEACGVFKVKEAKAEDGENPTPAA